MFYVGQKVVCVDDKPRRAGATVSVKKGGVYAVRWAGVWVDPWSGEERRAIRVEGITNIEPSFEWRGDVPYLAARFRPAVERKTDISAFTEILDRETIQEPVKTPKKERA